MTDSPYAGLDAAVDDARWAFGTGFTDPLAGLDARVPAGIDAAALGACCLALGDDALIMSQRLQGWITKLPELEIEAAVANIALDFLGQARLLLSRAGVADGHGLSDDDLAFGRDAAQFQSVRFLAAPHADFADLMCRVLIVATWRVQVMRILEASADPLLAAIATRSVAELAYHAEHAGLWVVRLGDGTDLSHRRMQAALDRVWPDAAELFDPECLRVRTASDPRAGSVSALVAGQLDAIWDTATVTPPTVPVDLPRRRASSQDLLALVVEMQEVARQLPDGVW